MLPGFLLHPDRVIAPARVRTEEEKLSVPWLILLRMKSSAPGGPIDCATTLEVLEDLARYSPRRAADRRPNWQDFVRPNGQFVVILPAGWRIGRTERRRKLRNAVQRFCALLGLPDASAVLSPLAGRVPVLRDRRKQRRRCRDGSR